MPRSLASQARFFALCNRPFWCDAGLSSTGPEHGRADRRNCTTRLRHRAALRRSGFIGVDAERRAALGEERVTRACPDQFARIGEARVSRTTLIKEGPVDPPITMAADRLAARSVMPGEVPWVVGLWPQRLTLAGRRTSPTEPGHLAGAIVAEQRALGERRAKRDAGDRHGRGMNR
jgi:monoamine oxidase